MRLKLGQLNEESSSLVLRLALVDETEPRDLAASGHLVFLARDFRQLIAQDEDEPIDGSCGEIRDVPGA